MSIEDYRKKDITEIIKTFENDVKKYLIMMDKKKNLGKLCTKLDLIATCVGIVITLVFSLLGTNDIIKPKVSIIVMESLFTAGTALLLLISRFGKLQNKKYYIYEKLKNFSSETLNTFKLLYSNILEDGVISKEDYESVIKFKNDYDSKKTFLKTELGNGYVKLENN